MHATLRRFEVPKMAFALILSNLTVPLLGLTDSIVMGHLGSAYFLAAVGFGVSIFDFIYWCFGFLRQGSTAFIAQAFGRQDIKECVNVFLRGLLLALVITLLLWLLMKPIADLIGFFLQSRPQIVHYTLAYFYVRIWAAPATLMNYVITAWFLGVKRTRYCLYQMLVINGTAIVLDVLLVFGLGMTVRGVALADVIGQYAGLAFGLYVFLGRKNLYQHIATFRLAWADFKKLLVLNRDIFIRTVGLMSAYLFFNYQSALFGKDVLAANVALVNIMMLMAYAQDGFNNVAEILVGNSLGNNNIAQFWSAIRATCFWSLIVALISTVIYFAVGRYFVLMITSIASVLQQAYRYLPWVIASPFITVWCYWLDGVFMGAAWGRELRNGMVIAAVSALIVWYLTKNWQVQGLWSAFMFFFFMRGVAMSWLFKNKVAKLGVWFKRR